MPARIRWCTDSRVRAAALGGTPSRRLTPAPNRLTMTRALKRCPGGHDLSGYTLGSGNAGSSSFFPEGTATWHGGRTDVMVARPGWTAANDALVTAPAV